jgi:hypothetical protein
MTALHLTLTIATYPEGDRWTWTLHAGRHIVASSGGQLFTRRIDCARGAEVGAGLLDVRRALHGFKGAGDLRLTAGRLRYDPDGFRDCAVDMVPITVLDERAGSEPTC